MNDRYTRKKIQKERVLAEVNLYQERDTREFIIEKNSMGDIFVFYKKYWKPSGIEVGNIMLEEKHLDSYINILIHFRELSKKYKKLLFLSKIIPTSDNSDSSIVAAKIITENKEITKIKHGLHKDIGHE